MSKLHHRNIRLTEYDYSQEGAYFVTICIQDRKCILGNIIDGQMKLNKCGRIVEQCWRDLVEHYTCVELDTFVIMPNHVHGIIVITGDVNIIKKVGDGLYIVGDGLKPSPTGRIIAKSHGLPEIVRAFKTFSARKINEERNTKGQKIWQRNYFEHIVRNEKSLKKIRDKYIIIPGIGKTMTKTQAGN